MCGRYKLTVSWAEIRRLYNLANNVNLRPRYNIAPTQDVLAILYDAETKQRRGEMVRWGLVPFWAKDIKVGYSLINARAETVASKPAFREAFKKRRCIIPADAFYEWQPMGGKRKQPYAVVMKDRSVFGFAGLWETWTDKASGEVIWSCTIIATEANALLAPIRDRMAVILDPKDYTKWWGEELAASDELQAMLKPYPASRMASFKIGTRIGNVKYDKPGLIEPLASYRGRISKRCSGVALSGDLFFPGARGRRDIPVCAARYHPFRGRGRVLPRTPSGRLVRRADREPQARVARTAERRVQPRIPLSEAAGSQP
jgi:putative SOS response-associated peptidase YedK